MSDNLKKDILTAVEDGKKSSKETSKGSTEMPTYFKGPQVLKHCLNKPFRHPQKLLEHLHKDEIKKSKTK